MKMKNIYKLGTLILLGAACSACTFLDTEPQIIPSKGYYTNETRLKYGLAGVYGALNSEELYGSYYSLQIANADDLCYFNNYNNGETRPDRYNHSAGTSVIYETWLKLYEGIKNANEYLDEAGKAEIDPEKLSTDLKSYLAEARFLRAFYHFLLAQAWGDVPLRSEAATSPNPVNVQIAATPQEEVLKWCVDEIEAIVYDLDEGVEQTPSRVNQTVAEGILARIYLFMAGETVDEVEGLSKQEMYGKAAYWANEVIASQKHHLNESYEQVFINMIQDQYDTEFRESMWEAEFLGDRTSSTYWTNGRIGDLIGLKSQSGTTNYSEWACNYSYGYYNGSYTLWQLYWTDDRTADEVFAERNDKIDYMVGTMIEVPRAAVTANQIAEVAQFFSFGTNDLTQMTLGFSRDDIAKFLPVYLEKGILKNDPFQILDRNGVGQLIREAVFKGRSTRPQLKCGICGEHGGEPSSVEFCHYAGLNYVSCSPFRVPIARLAAAHAALSEK